MKKISLTVNGNQMLMQNKSSVTDLISNLGFSGKRLAVERNGEIVPKSEHSATQLADGDRFEIVVAVGGG